MRSRSTILILVLILSTAFLSGQDAKFTYGMDGIKRNWAAVPTGLFLKFGYGSLGLVPGLRSDLEANFGAGYENIENPRDDGTGDPLAKADLEGLNTVNAQIELGFRQGILPLDDKRDHLSAFASLHGRVAENFGSTVPSTLPDRNEELMASLVAGLSLADSTKDAHAVRNGHYATLEGEWGPSFLSAESTDFIRLKAEWVEYLPLFDLGGERNLLSSYLAVRGNANYIDGVQVPLFMLEYTDVRGYPYPLDTKLRVSGSAEIRFNLPSFVGASSVFPVVYAFADGGWYSGYSDLAPLSTWEGSSGPLAAVGGGVAIDIFGAVQIGVALGVPLLSDDSNSTDISKGGQLWWAPTFTLKY